MPNFQRGDLTLKCSNTIEFICMMYLTELYYHLIHHIFQHVHIYNPMHWVDNVLSKPSGKQQTNKATTKR